VEKKGVPREVFILHHVKPNNIHIRVLVDQFVEKEHIVVHLECVGKYFAQNMDLITIGESNERNIFIAYCAIIFCPKNIPKLNKLN